MPTIVWIHHDALSRDHPIFAAEDGARAVFVWDAEDIGRRGWTLKRCVFVMECVKAMGIDILEGDTLDVLRGLDAGRYLHAETPDPALRDIAAALYAETVPDRPFTDVPDTVDMGRYFRFWNKAKRSALTPTAEIAG